MTSDVKRVHEAEVFRAFIEACRLPIDHESVENVEPDYPDIRCLGADGKARLFELGEILWEDESANVKTLPHGEALSAEAAARKDTLISSGRTEEAERIQTWGVFEVPVLGSLLRMLDKKCQKRYRADGHPLSLLLYYEREQPNDPFEELFNIADDIHHLLTRSQFSEVWLYHHARSYSLPLPHMPEGAEEGLVFRVPLRSFATPAEQQRVIGHIAVRNDSLTMSFDASYSASFGRGIRLNG